MGEVTVKGGKAILRFAPAVQAEVDGKRVTFIETDSKSARVTSANIGVLKVRLYFIRGEQLQISVSNPNWILRKGSPAAGMVQPRQEISSYCRLDRVREAQNGICAGQ
jgi:hypothetical protein